MNASEDRRTEKVIGSAIAVHRFLPSVALLFFLPCPSVILRGVVGGSVAFLLFLAWSSVIHAAFEFRPVGAQAAGMGDVGTGMASGAEGLFWNPAAVAWMDGASAFGGYDRPFGLKDLEVQALSGAVRLRRLGLGATYQGYGFALYREQVFGFTLGVRISQRVGLGLSVRRLQVAVSGRPTHWWTAFDLGFRALLNDRVFAGVAAWNAGGTRTRVLGQGGAFGLGVQIAPDLTVLADVQKEAGLPTGGGAGLVWEVASALVLRTGIGGRPERLSAGVGVRQAGFSVDYAAVWHTVLGLSHRVSLSLGR